MARQLGAALGEAVLVAVLGDRRAGDLTGFDRAWVVVVKTLARLSLVPEHPHVHGTLHDRAGCGQIDTVPLREI